MSLEDEVHVLQTKKEHFKEMIKERMSKHLHKEKEIAKGGHSKVKDIVHKVSNEPEQYMITNKITSKQASLLLNLRSKCEKSFKDNFKTLHKDNLCPLCGSHIDSQEFAFACVNVTQELSQSEKEVSYKDLFGSLDAQVEITKLFQKVLRLRENQESPRDQNLPTGASIPDPVASYL